MKFVTDSIGMYRVMGVGWVPITVSNIEVTSPYKNITDIEFGVSEIS